MSWEDLRASCDHKIKIDVPRRPANALCVEVGAPMPRCSRKLPSRWTGTGTSALRWLGSGGSPLVRTCEGTPAK